MKKQCIIVGLGKYGKTIAKKTRGFQSRSNCC